MEDTSVPAATESYETGEATEYAEGGWPTDGAEYPTGEEAAAPEGAEAAEAGADAAADASAGEAGAEAHGADEPPDVHELVAAAEAAEAPTLPEGEKPVPELGKLKSVRADKYGFVASSAGGTDAIFVSSECPLALSLQPGADVQFYSLPHTKGRKAYSVRAPCSFGTVKSFNPFKFGFLTLANGEGEAIFYSNDIVPGHTLQVGSYVEFDLKPGSKGQQAFNVAVAGACVKSPAGGMPSGGNRTTGTVKMYNAMKGFGFITLPSGEEALVNDQNIYGGPPLYAGETVEFEVQVGPKGSRAMNVCRPGAAGAGGWGAAAGWGGASPWDMSGWGAWGMPPWGMMGGGWGAPGWGGAAPGWGGAPAQAAPSGPREEGTVKSFNPIKGFGFIFTPEGDEAIVHLDQIEGYQPLQVNEKVEYTVLKNAKGKKAVNVRPLRYAPY